MGSKLLNSSGDPVDQSCAAAFSAILNNKNSDILLQMFVASGKSVQDLGNYEQCVRLPQLKYTLITIRSKDMERKQVQMGLCIPQECQIESLRVLNKLYRQAMIITSAVSDPLDPVYTFPQDDYQSVATEKFSGYIIMSIIFMIFIFLSIFGYIIENYKIGDKKNQSSMVEMFEEETTHHQRQSSTIETRKKKWALIIYSFSITRNFHEIFFRPYKSIKDKKFEVFNGIKFINMIWIMLGHCYLLACEFGNAGTFLKQQMFNQFFTQLVVSADYPISFFYFISGFIGMFALIKKYQRNEVVNEGPNTSIEETRPAAAAQATCVQRLTKKQLVKQILGRWLRLAFPTYIVMIFLMTLFNFFGTGPSFTYQNENYLQKPLREYWWTIILFIQNVYPWQYQPGMYWSYFVANELQLYIFIMMPSIYFYQRKGKRLLVFIYLLSIMVLSSAYLIIVTVSYKLSTLLTIDDDSMFNLVFRRPFGPAGYFSMGILFSIFYFEYCQAQSIRHFRDRKAYQFLSSIGKTRQRCLVCQFLGFTVLLFTLFIRYSCFGQYNNPESVDYGRWPFFLNGLFNGLCHYIYIISVIALFIPVFLGKLSIIRDIYASTFFRPLSRINLSTAMIQGVALYLVFFSQERHIYFDHKNVLFVYFALVLNVYLIGFLVALFLEQPFRTLGKVVFQPTKRVIRLKTELAKELATGIDSVFGDDDDDLDSEIDENEIKDDVVIEVMQTNNGKVFKNEDNKFNQNKKYAGLLPQQQKLLDKELKMGNRLTKIQESSEELSDREQLVFHKKKKD
eukprot:403339018